ncbi:MAG: GNAT family N-acetyltransferase [Deltaproteobacteria bacterium]|nr:MAG: GNAT family N-acetyltransferase [Deltaproteobacteria bacterium]
MLRRHDKAAHEALAWTLLSEAHAVHLCATLPDGQPLVRPLHAVIHDGAVYFHGAHHGEKNALVGRPAVVSTHKVYADIPSHWRHPERACPATTLYESAMVHGTVEDVTDDDEKAAMLARLMTRYQPEGGYAPIDTRNPLYTKAIREVRVLRVRGERVVAKRELFGGKTPGLRRKVAEALWRRGLPTDAEAAMAVLTAAPLDPWPERFQGPGVRFVPAPTAEQATAAAGLLRDAYWNQRTDESVLARAQRATPAWVVAIDADERVVATARALGDGHKFAHLADVMVAAEHRGSGLGTALIDFLLDHPAVRHCPRIDLLTRDAQGFYARMGFEAVGERTLMRHWRGSSHADRRAG